MSGEALGLIVAAASLAVAVVSFMHSRRRELWGDQRSVLDRVARLEAQMELMLKDVSFAASYAAAATLHRHDDAHQMDELIEKFTAHRLALEEVPVFVERLQRVAQPDSDANDSERYAAEVLLRALEQRYA